MSSNNGKLHDEFSFGNVLLRVHPNGNSDWQKAYQGFDRVEWIENVRGRLRIIDQREVHFDMCKTCIVRKYNPGIMKYSCSNPLECPAVYAPVSDHNKMGFKSGERAE